MIRNRLDSILRTFPAISLEEMGKVRLMNRIDTKYVTTTAKLERLLEMAAGNYRVQQIGTELNLPYYTCYFDTEHCDMYAAHQRGKKTRQKIRLRVYEQTGTAFLEIKDKNNKGRTDKIRTAAERGQDIAEYADFIRHHSLYDPEQLMPRLQNRFRRITLVNNSMTERLTIDTCLCFHSLITGTDCTPEGIAIIELKRSGNTASPILGMLRELHIHPSGFSKYCVGMALTDRYIKQNRLKMRLRSLEHICPLLRYGASGLSESRPA